MHRLEVDRRLTMMEASPDKTAVEVLDNCLLNIRNG